MKKQHITPINSGIKVFDKAADGHLFTGNATTNIQTSSYIRAKNTLECNGRINSPGHLRNFDLKLYRPDLPSYIHSQILDLTEDDNIILYKIFHWARNIKHVHGYIATYTEKRNHALLRTWQTGHHFTSGRILNAVVEYVANREDYQSISVAEYMKLDQTERSRHRFTLEDYDGISQSLMDTVDIRRFLEHTDVTDQSEPDFFLLQPDSRLVAFFTDGSKKDINYGFRLRIWPTLQQVA